LTRARRLAVAALGAVLWAAAVGFFAPASAETQRELVAEGVAQAFTIRVSADYGGAAKLPFFFGSYADANLTNPPAGADGQASWYNLGIAETAVFTPPGECTPEEQQKRIGQAITDVTEWATTTAIPRLLKQHEIAVLPIPTVPCSERLPGFSQSRYPETQTIASADSDDLLWSGVCAAGGCPLSDALKPATESAFDGGHFVATATDRPSQNSDASMAGIHVPGVLDIGAARSIATASLEGDKLITQATWAATDVCVAPGDEGCALSIRSVRQFARVVRDASGKVVSRDSRTVIAGVEGDGRAAEVTTADLGPGLPPVELGENLFIRSVSSTGDCGDPAGPGVADAGGLEIFGQGSGAPTPTLPVPIVGSTTGGGVLLGGACAAGRLQSVTFDVPAGPGLGSVDVPGTTIVGPGSPGAPSSPRVTGPQLSDPRVVAKESVRYILRSAPAWRTARYWGSVLAALMLAIALGYFFRRSRPVAPVVSALDRFARQFVRG
jgi:hypothetical protein